jgi:hypothetical protein
MSVERRRAAALHRWHEPDESRGSSPYSQYAVRSTLLKLAGVEPTWGGRPRPQPTYSARIGKASLTVPRARSDGPLSDANQQPAPQAQAQQYSASAETSHP